MSNRVQRPKRTELRERGRLDKRNAIVEAAKRVFLRRGYTEASVDAIASEAGVSKQTIYNHFGDKEQLFLTVIQTAQRDAEAEARGAVGDDPGLTLVEDFLGESNDLDRDLRAFAQRSARFALREDIVALRRLVVAEAPNHPELVAEWGRRRPELELALARAIDRQSKRGVLDVPDAALAAHQFVLLILVEALMRSSFGAHTLSDAELEAIVDAGVEMWLRCYRAAR
ncbi:MAG TPA: TetR/AcrR family transcriptional regulator [Gaiellaceae bacterium]|jgi:TetR/AcrR family transcriptional repressor of mexJK operon|nr:TetR/AcrR family transcriptional regulator [Gaiellaceae bacterium]